MMSHPGVLLSSFDESVHCVVPDLQVMHIRTPGIYGEGIFWNQTGGNGVGERGTAAWGSWHMRGEGREV